MNRSPFRRVFLLIPLVLACFALSPKVQAKGPPINCNTSEGYQALINITTGVNNTAFGCAALFADTTGSDNTATGSGALNLNNGSNNTATGWGALRSNTSDDNTAVGSQALYSNTVGFSNTAVGRQALFSNSRGPCPPRGPCGFWNTAVGSQALYRNSEGEGNTADGYQALYSNNTGGDNTAIGFGALGNNTDGSGNIALGASAGYNLSTVESGNIDIGNAGVAGDSSTTRIGSAISRTFIAAIRGVATDNDNAIPVVIDSAGQLGTVSSSVRFKTEIKPMDRASEAILALQPVIFHYKTNIKGTPHFGLIAEDVAKVNPDLVVRDGDGKVYTVRYDAVNAMLLNEFLKEHRKVEEQDRQLQKQEVTIAKQQRQIEALTAGLQKISDRLELNKPTPRVVVNSQ